MIAFFYCNKLRLIQYLLETNSTKYFPVCIISLCTINSFRLQTLSSLRSCGCRTSTSTASRASTGFSQTSKVLQTIISCFPQYCCDVESVNGFPIGRFLDTSTLFFMVVLPEIVYKSAWGQDLVFVPSLRVLRRSHLIFL